MAFCRKTWHCAHDVPLRRAAQPGSSEERMSGLVLEVHTSGQPPLGTPCPLMPAAAAAR
jgi:hypothetical protein